MKKITIFDTSICSRNIGDFIIMDSVNRELHELFKKDMIFYTTIHEKISIPTYRLNRMSDYCFVGGTNLLTSNMIKYNQWKINIIDSFFLKNITLLGVGWWQYQTKPNWYTRFILKSVLHSNLLHSVRDSYTEAKMKSIGINNVINTGCPTIWNLTEQHCKKIPKKKADSVVFTLTDYNKNIEYDAMIIDLVLNNYTNVYFWPQGSGDFNYLKSFKRNNEIEILGGSLFSYDELLNKENMELDFIGTRLHAGIRAIQKERRSIIIGIDNRAAEKAKDFNLKVVSRDSIKELEILINSEFKTEININQKNIDIWKNQFRNLK